MLAQAESEMGYLDVAVEAFQRSLELTPGNAELWFNLGTILGSKLDRNEDAVQAFEKAMAIDPKKSAVWCNYGNALSRLGRINDGENAFRKAIDIDPACFGAWSGLGDMFVIERGDYKEAEKAYRNALASSADDIDILKRHGLALWRSGRRTEAEKAIKHAMKIAPQDSSLWSQLGVMQSYPKLDAKKAEKSFRKAVKLDPGNYSAWNNLGNLLKKTLRNSEAEQAYRQAVELRPDDLAYKLRLAAMLVINKKWLEAEKTVVLALHDREGKDDLLLDILSFYRTAVDNGYTQEAIALLEQPELDDSWRSLSEALKAIQAGTKDYFFNIAPEVRSAAEDIYEILTEDDAKQTAQ